jgi:hypothetical protein
MTIRTSLLCSILALSSASALAASRDFEGYWIRDCGQQTYCRVAVQGDGKSSYDVFFEHTSPSQPSLCNWNAKVKYQKSDDMLAGKGGMTARIESGKLHLSGIPGKCKQPGREGTFERDQVDEYMDY